MIKSAFEEIKKDVCRLIKKTKSMTELKETINKLDDLYDFGEEE